MSNEPKLSKIWSDYKSPKDLNDKEIVLNFDTDIRFAFKVKEGESLRDVERTVRGLHQMLMRAIDQSIFDLINEGGEDAN